MNEQNVSLLVTSSQRQKQFSFTFFASFSAFCFSFSSFFLLSFDDDAELAAFKADVALDFDELGAEETVYGLKPSDDGLTPAGWALDLVIRVAFDMIGATFALFMLSFFAVLVGAGAVDVDGSSSSGTISDAFIAFDVVV